MPHLHHQRSPSKQSRRVQDIPPIKGHPAEASSKTTSVASESTGKAKYMFLPVTSGVETTKEPHTHASKVLQKQTDQTNPWRRDLHPDVLFEAARKNYKHTHRKNVKYARRCQSPCNATWACASVSVQVHGAPPSINKTPTMVTVRTKTANDSQDAHTCNRGVPVRTAAALCQKREGSPSKR